MKLEDIRREQQYQREREADFRDLSESTNSRALWYSVAQISVLLGTCFWQLRHLKASAVDLSLFFSFGGTHVAPFYRDSLKIEKCDSMYILYCRMLFIYLFVLLSVHSPKLRK